MLKIIYAAYKYINLAPKFFKMKTVTFLTALFINIIIVNAQTVGLPPFGDVCENEAAFALNSGTPSGGTYSGAGVVNGVTFNPSLAGVGTHAITYTFINSAGVQDTTQTIQVLAAPVAALGSFPLTCESDIAISLNQGTPVGGEYSGLGVYFGAIFFIDSVGVGSYPIQYKYVDGTSGCSDSATSNIVINPSPSVNLISFPGICEDESSFTMVGGTPNGGVYVLNNTDTVSTFDPAVFGPDSHLVNYYYTNTIGCTGADTSILPINAIPNKPNVFPFSSDTLLCTTVGDDYEWFKNDSVVGLNQRKLPVGDQSGIFKVRVTKEGCISEVSNPYTYGEAFSVDEKSNEIAFTVFPNPNNGLFQISSLTTKKITLTVYNVLGAAVYSDFFVSQKTIDLQGMQSGIYLIELKDENRISTYPIIIE